jgi:nucleotide-binding universal stress UspA family protein
MDSERSRPAPASMPTKILVAVEGSEPSLKESSLKAANYALMLASGTSAEVQGVCVIQIPEYIEEETRASLRQELSAKSRATLEEVKALAESVKVKFGSRTIETSGAISTAICDLSDREGFDLIVLGTRANTSSLTKMMLGSVASGVASNANCPVLVVR